MERREDSPEQLGDRQEIGGRPSVHDPAHPGLGDPVDRRLAMPAGRVFGVVSIALLVAAIFNSDAMVRAGEGMRPGATRDVVLAVAKPIDAVAGAVALDLPRKGFDAAFGQESKTASGTELEEGSAGILRRRASNDVRESWPEPTPSRPLKVLVTGDSEADLVGLRLDDLDARGLLDIETVARNGTALTNPGFFNWEVNAEQEIERVDPDAVVMLIGANDGFNVTVDGEVHAPATPGWEEEFARRVAVVMRTFAGIGERPVYWVPPPTARDETFDEIYASENRAVERAAKSVTGARYIDVYSTINSGEYTDRVRIDGRLLIGRQSDGIHFNRDGAFIPAKRIWNAMARDFPALR